MNEKYLSIITNFGCHYKCPYCIVKKNNLKIPKTTIAGLTKLKEEVKSHDIDIVSISGGGDPLFRYWNDNKEYYIELFKLLKDIPIELHTSYLPHNVQNKSFPIEKCYRVVYHASNPAAIKGIHKRGNEKIRVVFVVTEFFTKAKIKRIFKEVKNNDDIEELSFRQMVDSNYQTTHYCEEYLQRYHKKKWHYILQNDYNLYYCENKISYTYANFR